MSTIWLRDEHSRLKSYSASTKGSKSVVRIEIEVDEPGALGYLLLELGEIEREQKAAEKPAKPKKQARLALPAPVAQLPYFGED